MRYFSTLRTKSLLQLLGISISISRLYCLCDQRGQRGLRTLIVPYWQPPTHALVSDWIFPKKTGNLPFLFYAALASELSWVGTCAGRRLYWVILHLEWSSPNLVIFIHTYVTIVSYFFTACYFCLATNLLHLFSLVLVLVSAIKLSQPHWWTVLRRR